MHPGIYFGLLTPEDNGEPEMFFRTEEWARKALAELIEVNPRAAGQVFIVRYRVVFEVLS